MKAIVENMKNLWNVCGHTADRCVKATKRECKEIENGWTEVNAYWMQHPETRPELRLDSFRF